MSHILTNHSGENSCLSTLCDVDVNLPVRVKALNAEPAVCQRLREMGFCEFAEVRKIQHGNALICHVCGVNLILSHYLAKNILVERIDASTTKHFPESQ